MPRAESEGYRPPPESAIAAVRSVFRQMLDGACDTIQLPSELAGIMQVRSFVDQRSYCVLSEIEDANGDGYVDRGWGTLIVDAAADRELVHGASHPLADTATETESIAVYRSTHARAFVLAGAHRRANAAASPCQPSFLISDAAHNRDMFEGAIEELGTWYGSRAWTMLEWHGMATTTCPGVNVYLSPGVAATPPQGSAILTLRDRLRAHHPSWTIEVASETPVCQQNATNNVHGRFLNGVDAAQVCDTRATSQSGRFIHVEQQPKYRDPADWTEALLETFPSNGVPEPPPPAAPSRLELRSSKGAIALKWTASVGATSYAVHRATTSGGPYAAIASTSSTSYRDKVAGSFCYVVTARNAWGESSFSNEVCGSAR